MNSPNAKPRSRRMVWLADFFVAGFLALIVTYFLTDWLADRACAELGGTMRRAGADALCETPTGTHTEASIVKGSSVLYIWIGATSVFYLLARLFIKRKPRGPAPTP